jgi:hypothetical protein
MPTIAEKLVRDSVVAERYIGLTHPIAIQGDPRPSRISTSHIERLNRTVRMQMRRFTRLTDAFSKKLDDLKLAVALFVAFYNLCRVHQTLRVTPAMEAGLTGTVWTVRDLLTRDSARREAAAGRMAVSAGSSAVEGPPC